ncbi:glycosyl hydrolase family 28-related protein, partial [uncultured Mucilaginibacter sp.]|uniref:glycosyl hydrolase family 28-related protein n=1 Tax=uncultured Mucilaginibacter sp. TaxID=797541 RepID=UPI0025EF999D
MFYSAIKISIVLSVLLSLCIQPVSVRDKKQESVMLNADTVNVKTFGARGDNIQNDSAAFQKAIIYASGSRKVLLVPKGIYKISNLVVYPNVKIVGVNGGSVLVLTDGTQNNRQCLSLTDISKNILIRNIAFDANGKNNTGKNIFCIKSTLSANGSINNLVIQNCSFTGSKNYGSVFLIGMPNQITNVVVYNCSFHDLGSAAVSVRGINGLTFANNIVTNWDLLDKINSAFQFQSEPCSNIVFRNNHFKNKDAAYFA